MTHLMIPRPPAAICFQILKVGVGIEGSARSGHNINYYYGIIDYDGSIFIT